VLLLEVTKSRRMRWSGHVALTGEGNGAYRVFVEKPEGKRPHRRPRSKWKDKIKMDLRLKRWEHGFDRSDSGQVEVASCFNMNLQFNKMRGTF
jgi:hypothetical protein